MMRTIPFLLTMFACAVAGLAACGSARASDQARAIVNAIDPKVMNELLETARTKPDVSLANLVPVEANKFRFLFIWPAANTSMTQDRIGQSFAQRFLLLADQQKLLANGYCLPARGIVFGTTMYADQEVNVAYRDIEVRYLFGPGGPCPGHYIAASDFFKELRPTSPSPKRLGSGMLKSPVYIR